MNITDYIASGIIEQYVLGDVSPQEKKEVECMSHIYPEIQEEILSVQKALEGFAMSQAISAPKHIKENIFAQIDIEYETFVSQAPPVADEKSSAVVVPLDKTNQPIVRPISFNQYVVAASLLFVIVTSVSIFSYQSTQRKVSDLQNQLVSAKNQLEEQKIENLQLYLLEANKKAPNTSLSVVWNRKTGQIFVQKVSLPIPPINKQYQLWGLKNGKPIDLGVFDVSNKLQVLKSIGQIDALAVTLEKQGGNPTPHLDELYAILNI